MSTLPEKTWAIGLFLAFMIIPIISSAEDIKSSDGSVAEVFIQNLGDKALSSLTGNNISDQERNKRLRDLLNDNFSMGTIGRFAMGKHWRSASDKQKEEYLSLFEDLIVDTYSQRFREYSGQKFIVKGHQEISKKDTVIHSEILPPEGSADDAPSIKIDWRVRFKKDEYRVVDISVEGVSMIVTQRSDFDAVIQRGGGKVEALLASLRDRNNGEEPKEL